MQCARENCWARPAQMWRGFTGLPLLLCRPHRNQVLYFEYRSLCALEVLQ